ncbi:MAG: EF-hand domain-containing protein, partial [Planctomycetota bacterium]
DPQPQEEQPERPSRVVEYVDSLYAAQEAAAVASNRVEDLAAARARDLVLAQEAASAEELQTMLKEADTDGSGSIDYDEFLAMLRASRETAGNSIAGGCSDCSIRRPSNL